MSEERDMINATLDIGRSLSLSAFLLIGFLTTSIRDSEEPRNSVTFPKRTCYANQAGENSSFIFTVCVKSVPRYHFKLTYVILQMAVKEFFETHF